MPQVDPPANVHLPQVDPPANVNLPQAQPPANVNLLQQRQINIGLPIPNIDNVHVPLNNVPILRRSPRSNRGVPPNRYMSHYYW
jgi:hypothetical protein